MSKRVITIPCHRVKASSTSKDARNTDIPVVIKIGEYAFVNTTVRADTKGFGIDLKELLHAHDWSGILYNCKNHNVTIF